MDRDLLRLIQRVCLSYTLMRRTFPFTALLWENLAPTANGSTDMLEISVRDQCRCFRRSTAILPSVINVFVSV